MKKQIFVVRNGDHVAFPQSDDANAVCPICGYTFRKLGVVYDEISDGIVEAGFADCPSCGVKYGYQDALAEDDPYGTLEQNWERLRLGWLNRVGWSKASLCQLHDNLGLTDEELRREADEIQEKGTADE